jgi:HAE1 family hydrophobic/amphiphilic exporter-1
MPGVSGGTGTGGMGGGGSPLQIEISGPTLDKVVAASYKVQDNMEKLGNIKDIRSSYTEGSPEYAVTVDRQRLRYFNVTTENVDNAFSNAITGVKAGYFTNDPSNDNQDTQIYVRYKGANSFKASDLRSIPITTKK